MLLKRLVKCPRCAGDSVYGPGNAYRPFCSERCKNIDLGAWSSESFRLPDQPPTEGSYEEADSLPQ